MLDTIQQAGARMDALAAQPDYGNKRVNAAYRGPVHARRAHLQLARVGHAGHRLDDAAHDLRGLRLGHRGEQRPQLRQQLPQRLRVALRRVEVGQGADGWLLDLRQAAIPLLSSLS